MFMGTKLHFLHETEHNKSKKIMNPTKKNNKGLPRRQALIIDSKIKTTP